MRIVVSGTHATGKSTLVSDFAMSNRQFEVLPDPFDLVDVGDPASAESFGEQLTVAADRLLVVGPGADVIAERGPLDFLAYLEAAEALGRAGLSAQTREALRQTAAAAMARVDLLVVLPLTNAQDIWVPDEEDPELRQAMDEHLLELCRDEEMVGHVGCVIEIVGSPERRLGQLLECLEIG